MSGLSFSSILGGKQTKIKQNKKIPQANIWFKEDKCIFM